MTQDVVKFQQATKATSTDPSPAEATEHQFSARGR